MAEEYLYGAEVQGIQDFIYSTNKLKEIVGASELVEEICTEAFKAQLGKEGFKEEDVLVMAAGKIRYVFHNKTECEKLVREFPKKVMEMAPGITFSQSVVPLTGNYTDVSKALETRLREQRNQPFRSPTIGYTGVQRSRRTGLPAILSEQVDGEYLDDASIKKLSVMGQGANSTTVRILNNKLFGDKNKVGAYDISQLSGENSWIAIVHADGNGLGQVVQKIGDKSEQMKLFSKYLDAATTAAAQKAYAALGEQKKEGCKVEPIRPIVLGGDDLTVICRADIALQFVENFLREFERCTGKDGVYKDEFAKGMAGILRENKIFSDRNHLTACAGIAYIKSSYPFYYGYNLAEELCSEAKKESKEISGGMASLPPSSVMFHRVQSSFVESYGKIVEKELTANKTSLKFGPYYLNMNHVKNYGKTKDGKLDGVIRWSIDELKANIDKMVGNADQRVKSNLRDYLTLLISNPGYAVQRSERIIRQLEQSGKTELAEFVKGLTDAQGDKSFSVRNPLYDMLVLNSVKTNTKINNEK